MPNTYANLGSTIGDILGRAGGGGIDIPRGYTAGMDAGSKHMLRSAQTGNAMADMDKVLYELDQAKRGDSTTGADIAEALGVDRGAYQAMAVPGATQMPAIPGAEGPALPVDIPQAMRDKFNNANTLKVLSQLTGGTSAGGTADTMMAALLKGQDLGTMSNMQAGDQIPADVAEMKAAMEGKYPGTTGSGGGSTASKVQEMRSLTAVYRKQGMDDKQAHDAALLSVYGDPENEAWVRMFTQAYSLSGDAMEAIEAADRAATSSGSKTPGNVVKVYK